MKRYQQFQPLVISRFESTEWTHPRHRHNHYELIFIERGSGIHSINRNEVNYQPGDIFLIGPEDEHSFEIAALTGFVFIKFTDANLYAETSGLPQSRHLEYLIRSRETHLLGFKLSQDDQLTAERIVAVVTSLSGDMFGNQQLIWLQVLALAELLQRNMPEVKATANRSRDMQAFFCYLHKHIYFPDKLTATVLAAQFNTTPAYIGPYFKRNAGMTLRKYIGDYRRILIRQRLASGNYSLKQIAAEFCLTDESHVSKLK